MGLHERRSDHRSVRRGLKAAGIVLAVVAVGALVWFVFLTIPATVDGKAMRLRTGTRVADLQARKLVGGAQGNLVAAGDKRVLKQGGGYAPYVVVNGREAKPADPLYASDAVESHAGHDRVEPITTTRQPIPPPVQASGEGPIEIVVRQGTPGVEEIGMGSLSKQIVKRTVVVEPVPTLMRRQEQAPKGAKVVALTFDDGPWPGSTEKILGVLAQYDVKATFFMLGNSVRNRPATARKVAEAGMVVANHSISHPDLTKLSAAQVTKQIRGAQQIIASATGRTPTYFRPPYGAANKAVRAEIANEGLRLVEWSVDTEDWKRPGVGAIVSRAVNGTRPGSVILMHDGGGDRSQTAAALPQIIAQLRAKGYIFVTLDYLSSLPGTMG